MSFFINAVFDWLTQSEVLALKCVKAEWEKISTFFVQRVSLLQRMAIVVTLELRFLTSGQ